jgi:hypothetical protein
MKTEWGSIISYHSWPTARGPNKNTDVAELIGFHCSFFGGVLNVNSSIPKKALSYLGELYFLQQISD